MKRIILVGLLSLSLLAACDGASTDDGTDEGNLARINACSAQGKLPVAVSINNGYGAVIYCADWPKGR